MTPTMDSLALFCLGIYLLRRLLITYTHSSRPPFPPGPPGYPFIGNLLDMPKGQEWEVFAKWSKVYGNIVSVEILGKHIIVLNSANLAKEMLDKQGAVYSDRPVVPMGGELVGWNKILGLTPYGERFRIMRRMIHQSFGKVSVVEASYPIQELETHRLLKSLLVQPNDFVAHIRRTSGAIILRISYGYQVAQREDPLVEVANRALRQFALSSTAGGFLVNVVPFLKHVPTWFPGAGFKSIAKEWAATLDESVEKPFQTVKSEIASGAYEPSVASRLLNDKNFKDLEYEIKWSTQSLYTGKFFTHACGSDTTVAAITAFLKAMVMFPEVQAKAQAEIDALTGCNRLPELCDRSALQYNNALALEVLRWYTVAPTGLPHRAQEDNTFEGYFIPRGSLVLVNLWSIAHDSEVYHDPMSFCPERFIETEAFKPELDPRELVFGFGRRICPGLELADSSLFIACAMILSVYNIEKHSENGVVDVYDLEQSDGTISHPSPFRCTITPRSTDALALIESELVV